MTVINNGLDISANLIKVTSQPKQEIV